jgi:hypothetical protein
MKTRLIWVRACAAVAAFGALAWFLGLIGLQVYQWFRDGEWTHIGVRDGLLSLVSSCCVRDESAPGMMAAFMRWLESPDSWLGLHRVLEAVPASVGLFLLSVFANFIYIYCSDRLDELTEPVSDEQSKDSGAG